MVVGVGVIANQVKMLKVSSCWTLVGPMTLAASGCVQIEVVIPCLVICVCRCGVLVGRRWLVRNGVGGAGAGVEGIRNKENLRDKQQRLGLSA
jgi:hypothetical protein